MQIIAGRARRRLLQAPPGRLTRPTLARVREAVFSMLDARLGGFEDLRVLDLFAGSGALGLEAWSRGATHVTFVEADRHALRALDANLAALGALDNARVLRATLPAALDYLAGTAPFDLVLSDAPYGSPDLEPTLERLVSAALCDVDGLVLVEHDARRPPRCPAELVVVAEKRYGETGITLLQRPEA